MTNKFRGDHREAWGITATFKSETSGEILTLHRTGKHALSEACDAALSVDPAHRLFCISTPETIYQDLKMPKINPQNHRPSCREAIYLGKAKRPEMLHSRWIGRNRDGRDNRGWK
jgi:hypothetical protein